MPLPWKKSKSKSGRISRFVSDLQQSPKHGGSLVVETGFPTSLIDLFVKNRDRLKKPSSKRNNKAQTLTAPTPPRLLVSSPSSPLPLQRHRSLPQELDSASVTEDKPPVDKTLIGGLTAEDKPDGGGCCVLMTVAFKIFVVVVLALSTKKLAVGITLSAFALLFLEFAVARVFTLLNICPNAHIRFDTLIVNLLEKRRHEKVEVSLERRNIVSFEIIEEISVPQSEVSSTLEKAKPVVDTTDEKKVETIRDVLLKTEKSRSAKLKYKIVKKLRSYKKKKKLKIKAIELVDEEESSTEVSSLFSDQIIDSEISERDDVSSTPSLLESCAVIEEEEEENVSNGDLTKAIVLIVIALVGLLGGKVLAIGLTLCWCLILRVFYLKPVSKV